ncbi:hypothetical protein [Hydrogenophaga palleronii]|uniref:hypothetical protein n=1 Tax=Hydrogenophaga palleronii TaxID=65655 RepID=UPI0012ED77BB|nr:hypothetical protein [Hydrogenophaga palleronii]
MDACAVERELVIGALALQDKDAAVLRVLVRLLDGSMSLRLRFGEQLAACNIVFVPAGCDTSHPGVRVQVTEGPATCATDPGTITVPAPLRMSNVMGALHKALARIHPPALADQSAGLAALFQSLRQAVGPEAPPRCIIPLHSGHLLLIDAPRHRMQTAAPIEMLLAGECHPGTLRPAGRVDEEQLHSAPSHALRDFVWRLSQRLVDLNAAPPPLAAARWHLRRWPEAVALMAPGHPRLAALLTARPHSLAELGGLSGLPLQAVQWFLLSGQLVGVAEHGAVLAAEPAPTAPTPPAPSAAPGWLGQLRERLKLW